MNNKPLRVVLLYSSGHLGSATVFNKLCTMPEYEVVGLVRCQTLSLNKNGIKKAWRHAQKLGFPLCTLLMWQRFIQMLVALLSRCLPRQHKWRPGWALSAKHKIPVYNCRSINDINSIQWMQDQIQIS